MVNPPQAAVTLYLSGFLALGTGLQLAPPRDEHPQSPLGRGEARGEVAAGIPRLDPGDGMANSALLMASLARVPNPAAGPRPPGSATPRRAPSR